LTDVGTFAFNSCSLVDIALPASVNNILDRSFGSITSLRTAVFERAEQDGITKIPYIHYNAFSGSGKTVFILPWTIEQHRAKFIGTYEDWSGAIHDCDVFFGAKNGSILRFIDKDGNIVTEIEKTMEGEQPDVYV
jgi:hypothetical protein